MITNWTFLPGSAWPLGCYADIEGINFALSAKEAYQVNLCLFPPNSSQPIEIPLKPPTYKTGDTWHIKIKNLPPGYRYAYRVDGPYQPQMGYRYDNRCYLLDPYAQHLDTSTVWGEFKTPLAFVEPAETFDWQGVQSPRLSIKDLIIYEMHIRGFTQDPSSGTPHKGLFLGVIDKIPYLKELGVNAVELLPIHEFFETQCAYQNPHTGERLYNYWGYNTVNFFSPIRRYGTPTECKQMIKALHLAGIEVILDVVYNHTAEGDELGPTLSFRGLQNKAYYQLDAQGHYLNFSGCGNTVSCNHPLTRQLILSSLRFWVEHFHIDGFRFDLASIFSRDSQGRALIDPPIIEEMASDPVLAKTKLIAEAWDAGGLYQVGSFPHNGRFSEWNGLFRDHVRSYIRGDMGTSGHFATRLCGSEDLYGSRSPCHSINFITAHDGFTLSDLVSYNHKHNELNGEHNRDGENNNICCNYGCEGPTDNTKILEIRERQKRNFLVALFVAQGIPMLHMGDEYGHTKKGNNNTWAQDNRLNWFQWDQLDANSSLFNFTKKLIAIRKKYNLLRRGHFFRSDEITFHGQQPFHPHWDNSSPFIAYTLKDANLGCQLYIAFNNQPSALPITLPPAEKGPWQQLINTALNDNPSKEGPLLGSEQILVGYTSLILISE